MKMNLLSASCADPVYHVEIHLPNFVLFAYSGVLNLQSGEVM